MNREKCVKEIFLNLVFIFKNLTCQPLVRCVNMKDISKFALNFVKFYLLFMYISQITKYQKYLVF